MPVSYGEWLFSVCLLVTYQVCLCVSCPSLPCGLWIRFAEKSPTSSGRQSRHPTAFPSCLALDRLPWTTPLQPCVVPPRSPVVRTSSVLGSAWPWTWEPGRVWTHPWVLGKFPWRHPAGKLFLGHEWCSASADHRPKATMGRHFLDWVSVTAELFPDLSFVCVVWKHDVSIWTGTILGLNFLVLPASSRSSFSTLEVAVGMQVLSRCAWRQWWTMKTVNFNCVPFQPSKGSGDSILRFLWSLRKRCLFFNSISFMYFSVCLISTFLRHENASEVSTILSLIFLMKGILSPLEKPQPSFQSGRTASSWSLGFVECLNSHCYDSKYLVWES